MSIAATGTCAHSCSVTLYRIVFIFNNIIKNDNNLQQIADNHCKTHSSLMVSHKLAKPNGMTCRRESSNIKTLRRVVSATPICSEPLIAGHCTHDCMRHDGHSTVIYRPAIYSTSILLQGYNGSLWKW